MPLSPAPWSSAPRASGDDPDRWVARQVEFFSGRGQVVEWKTYGYDEPADLPERLVEAGFVADDNRDGNCRSTASRMLVGIVSFVLCAMFTWSFGWTGGIPARAAEQLIGAVREHFVDVHVVRRARASLIRVNDEVFAVLASLALRRRRQQSRRPAAHRDAPFRGA